MPKLDNSMLKHLPLAYDWYEQRLREANAVDFDDLLSLTVALLRDDVRTDFSHHRRYVVLELRQNKCMQGAVITANIKNMRPIFLIRGCLTIYEMQRAMAIPHYLYWMNVLCRKWLLVTSDGTITFWLTSSRTPMDPNTRS